jgi:hypothetical protein
MELIALILLICAPRWVPLPGEAWQKISPIKKISQISVSILPCMPRDSTLMDLIVLIILICVPRWGTLADQLNHRDQSNQCSHPAVYAT